MDIKYTLAVFMVIYGMSCLVVKSDEFREERFISNETDYCVCKSSCEEYSFSADEYAKYETILAEELKTNGLLKFGWEMAKSYKRSHQSLSQNEVLSVVTYTLPNVYYMFNFLTRTRGIKSDAYPYKGMHFFLSSAVRKLAVKLPQSTFRCEKAPQAQALAIGNYFSFQQFASTTTDYFRAQSFGEFCFHIITLRGAPISSISSFPAEKEILIPSCETFQVVPLEEGFRFYAKLKSTGKSGNETSNGQKVSLSLLHVLLFPIFVNVLFLI
ncbi:erythroblast NAD(P)(+)--arginine ADP-ribosyltransferase-like [Mercenaria mercenaria]|uniref:erythroblast NAD(P)(+)--arginine ADP-ribosyltransferase-like n=1 Tax=Mercenaria mercenaria TaxID=6596 RepID=UPI00234F5D06|nr:erythroblast NAD(P)(+)--arginine ADP-ribosyltransferase-like [Mercenaria mercenaria]